MSKLKNLNSKKIVKNIKNKVHGSQKSFLLEYFVAETKRK